MFRKYNISPFWGDFFGFFLTSSIIPFMQTTPLTHIGFIMDGNRRWAKKLGNIAKIGHEN